MDVAENIPRKRARTEEETEERRGTPQNGETRSDSSAANKDTTHVRTSQNLSVYPNSVSRLEPSIFGKKPEEDIVLTVSNFIWRNISGGKSGAHLEIEGKLGLIIDKETGDRIRLPVSSETVIINNGQFRFDSNMTMAQHAHFNRILNAVVQRPGSRTRYVHTKEVDHYYQQGSQKIRVSADQKSGQVKEVLTKQRIADLEVHLPNSHLDFRISISLEIPAQRPPKDSHSKFRRQKDRLSYSHEAFRVDLTQVRQYNDRDMEIDVSHEVEVEFIRATELLVEKEKRQKQQQNNFADYVDIFLNNLRYLSRKAIPHNVG
ncbi:uncharacterized protein SPPG_04083 [Spizellomyces punctatus DAOM BR117]|uniref:mRNA-capping enzyme subunit beta n=1 Tax=Spizellomyces punctatus (strain DAOM BR117) TaxID=645134 RepID=A0A0L0HHN6_SPIPD|nr:uncharacterized protein SPPG_04083 [Spizellomyces punctatus DAOM BR117]KND00986.1 hypothetical protein SPPG_04083 [Spizellomyces punctatus DAOM BR117]|eukprot:XP_016609025.1 hypothetical protein SPPG_04083 [Spizellomyces punctatus DAOM BR117]